MMWIASSSASSASRGARRGPPYASMASQKPPAPSASSKRPPLSTSRLAAAFPMTAGGRSGRFATSEETHSGGDRRDRAEQGPGVHEAPLVRMILNADPVQAAGLDLPGSIKQRVGGVGDQEVSERQIAAVVRHRDTLSRVSTLWERDSRHAPTGVAIQEVHNYLARS